ncbi:hypothetical protein [Thermobifida halotolerans]|nr:hypothetical protein [Thermobifida halotolerans]
MDNTTDLVTLYAGPLDGLTIPAADLAALVRDHGTERFLFLTRFRVSGLYQEVDGRWVYAAPGLLRARDHSSNPPEETP